MSTLMGAFATCFLSAFFPWINAELVVVAGAAMVPPELRMPLVVFTTAGQMSGKVVVYAVARWAPSRLPARGRRLLDRAARFGRRGPAAGLTVMVSSAVGLPPLYLVTLACGTLAVPLRLFAVAGITGTLIRYAALAWGTSLVGTAIQ